MTIRSIGDVLIYLGAVAGALAALGIVLRFVVVKPLKVWVRSQVVGPMKEAKRQLEPNGGTQDTTRHLIESAASDSAEALSRLEGLTEQAAENRKLAMTALALAQDVGSRLDRHLAETARG